ncbi:MAG: sensor histidine kinase, partial [Candidatus Binatia bacterium]
SEARLRAIVEGTASTVGAEFFDALVTSMSRVLGMRWVLVSSLRDDSEAVVLAMWDGESVQSGFTYELEGTPCKVAHDVNFCVVADGAAAQYPDDEMFQEYNVRSYIGVVLRDRRGVPLGILSAFDESPLRNRRSAENLLRIFGARAAVELERMYVEAELFNSEEKTRAILESAADAIVTVNADGSIGTFNEAAENIFGFSADEIAGGKIDMLVAAPHAAELAAELCGQTAEEDRHFVGRRREVLGVRKNGSIFPMSMAMSEVQLSGQKVFTAVIRDITREKELEEMKSNIISSVSHEIRTPLTAILSSAKILTRSGGERPEITGKFAGIIVDEGERLTRLINDLLDFSKLDAGAIELSLEEIDPLEIVGRAVALSKADALEQGVLLGVESTEDIPLILTDSDKIMQVLTNLVNNAIKFTPQGGRVSVAVERADGDFIRISVTDTGVGIAQVDQRHIFERFKQLGSVLTDSPKGTGLGLAICKEIVDALGGKIWVESKPGEGSAFRFTVPMASTPTASRELRRQRSASEETEQPVTSGLFPVEQG